jgi:hypothetical protein
MRPLLLRLLRLLLLHGVTKLVVAPRHLMLAG